MSFSFFFFFSFLFFFYFYFYFFFFACVVPLGSVSGFWLPASCLLGYDLMLFTTIHEFFLEYTGSLFGWFVCFPSLLLLLTAPPSYLYPTLCIRIRISLTRLVIPTFLTT